MGGRPAAAQGLSEDRTFARHELALELGAPTLWLASRQAAGATLAPALAAQLGDRREIAGAFG